VFASSVRPPGCHPSHSAPLFLNALRNSAPRFLTVEVELVIPSLFQLASYQCRLWLAQIGSILYRGAWDPCDQNEIARAREIVLQCGDAVPIIARGKRTLSGVAILRQRIRDQVYSASLHLTSKADWIAKGVSLLSADACEIEGIVARFELPFAILR
jgi:hypothetical protein